MKILGKIIYISIDLGKELQILISTFLSLKFFYRSSRPTKRLDHADSLSSGEEDDDDGFELLTAENLFSTLLSRVSC